MQLLLAVHHICSSGFWCVCVPSLCAGNKKNRTMPHCITLNPLILELHFSPHADVVSRSSRCCWCTTEPGFSGQARKQSCSWCSVNRQQSSESINEIPERFLFCRICWSSERCYVCLFFSSQFCSHKFVFSKVLFLWWRVVVEKRATRGTACCIGQCLISGVQMLEEAHWTNKQ